MTKLSLERFREIKGRVAEIFDLLTKMENEEIQVTEKDGEKLESEIYQLNDEIHSSDLSDIPFEAYEGFYNLGFDFSGTGANIDFNIIREIAGGTVRLKGCNVRNFDFENQKYDEESFDEEFMRQHPNRFIDRGLPQEVRQRYYWKILEIADIIRYDLYNEIENGRALRDTVKFFKKVKPDVARLIEPDLFDVSDLRYSIVSSLENYEEEITEDTIKTLITENIESVLSRCYLDVNTYKRIIYHPNIRALIPEEQVIDFGENDELASRYLREDLSISDIHENQEVFRGKRFMSKLSGYRYSRESFEDITEQKIFYLFENFPDIADGIATEQSLLFSVTRNIDIEAPKEENLRSVQTQVIEILNSNNSEYLDPDTKKTLERYYSLEAVQSRLSDYDRSELETIMKYTTQERVQEYGISLKLFGNNGVRSLFSRYGLETVMEFDRANGNVFSKNDFALAKKMSDYYFHYAGNEHDPDRTIYYRSEQPEDWRAPYSMEDFEECVRRMIAEGPTGGKYSITQPIDFRDFSQEFKNKFPRMFLAEDAPQGLQDKFYTKTIDIGDLVIHPKWISFLEGRDFELGIQSPYISFRDTNSYDYYDYISFFEELRKLESSESVILKFINDNAKTVKMVEIYQRKSREEFKVTFEKIKDLDDFRDLLESKVETKILSGELEYGDLNIPDFFKIKHPDFFLDEDAPEALKNMFYSERRKTTSYGNSEFIIDTEDLETLKNSPNWQEFLLGKNKDIIKTILTEYVKQADSEAGKDTFLYFIEKQPEISMNIISSMSVEQIISIQIILSDEQIKELIEDDPASTLKVLLFSDKIEKDKISQLIKYKELNNHNNTIDSVLSNIYLSKDKIDYDEFNHQIAEIYDLFTYDNVPEFLKTFKLFELGNFANADNQRIASYQNLDYDSRNRIILSDLFRISLDSNNRSLRDFAEIMKYGDDISKKVYQNENLDLSSLSNEEQVIFSQYVDTLVAIHNISRGLKNDKTSINNTHNISTDYKSLLEQYRRDGGALESSRILTDLFDVEIQGEVSPKSILQYMDKKHELSSERRKQNAKKISEGSLHLESGDFIKGIRNFDSYLRIMLEAGLKGGEFNREHSHSDATPLDLDFGYISDANMQEGEQTDREKISSTISGVYGPSWIVLKQYEKHFEEEKEDMPIKFTRTPEYWTSDPDNNSSNKAKDRYIRTGIGVEDIDYIVSDEWKPSLGYEMAMAEIYIPVKDSQNQLVFSEEDYNKIREQMKGLSYYHADPFEISPKAKKVDSIFELYRRLGGSEEKIASAQEVLTGKEDTVTISKKKSTLEFIKDIFSSKGIHVTDNLSSDLSKDEIELIDTGSTGRGTNVPGDGDFDFMLRHNLPQEILQELQEYVFSLEKGNAVSVADGFRTKNTTLPDGQVVDIDITYARKDLALEYSSDMSIKDRLNSIKQNNPEDYNYVRANIIMAKNILKQIGVYKKRGSDGATEHGGFGGIGVENWILQNGGSFITAIDTYLEATKDENGENLSYFEFIERYPIYDFGNNHREGRLLHDRFSAFLGNTNDSDNHEKEFAFVKDIFKNIQKQLQEISISKNQTQAEPSKPAETIRKSTEQQLTETPTQEKLISPLCQSISVEGLKEASKTSSSFTKFCKQSFVLMAKLIAKYSNLDKINEIETRVNKKSIGE